MRILTDQEIVRREKAENIRNLGIDPFGVNIKMWNMTNLNQ